MLVCAVILSASSFAAFCSASSAEASTRLHPRIVGGTVAPSGSWRSIVALVASRAPTVFDGQFCAGTLISSSWVVTAAHCVFDDEGAVLQPTDFFIFAGEHDLADVEGGEAIEVAEIIPSPDYDRNTEANDIALLRLDTPSVQPVASVTTQTDWDLLRGGDSVEVAGWGNTIQQIYPCPNSGSCSRAFPFQLRQAEIRLVDSAACNSAYTDAGGIDSSSMFCAAGFDPPRDSCQGDSGGPVEADLPSGRVLVGLVSWGVGCADPAFPGVYTRIVGFRNWLGSYVARVAASPGSVAFGSVRVRSSKSKAVRLTNTTSLPAEFVYLLAGSGYSRAGGSCAGIIEGGATCTMLIRFRPPRRGPKRGSLRLRSASGVDFGTVSLLGTGR